MARLSSIISYADIMTELRWDWPSLAPHERLRRLQEAVNGAAEDAGFPPPKLSLPKPPLDKDCYGELNYPTWEININEQLTDKNSISDEEFSTLSGTIYHETRHAEQWYLIARRDAADGMTAKQIKNTQALNNPVVTKMAIRDPLAKNAPERACADAMYNSVYGTGATSRNATLNALGPNTAALRHAKAGRRWASANFLRISKDPNATAAQKKAAWAAWRAREKDYETALAKDQSGYAAYRALPEEADAWATGDQAEVAVANRLAPRTLPSYLQLK